MQNSELLIQEFEKALLQVNRIKAEELFEKSYAERNYDILEKLVIYALDRIGTKWENGTASLSQVYMSGIICEELMDNYLPKLNVERKSSPKMGIGVLQDYHGLGKRIVYSMLRASGYEVLDFGQGLTVDKLVQKTTDTQIDILLISTLMLPSALQVSEVKQKLTKQGFATKIVVGGAPFRLDNDLWKTVGADADGKNASNALNIIERMRDGAK